MHTTTPNVNTPTPGALKHVHEFETLASLRAEVERLEAGWIAAATHPKGARCQVFSWPHGQYCSDHLEALIVDLEQQVAALTAERDELKAGLNLVAVIDALGTWPCLVNIDAVGCSHHYCRYHALVSTITTLRQLVLTDEAINELASRITSNWHGDVAAALRNARGVKEKS